MIFLIFLFLIRTILLFLWFYILFNILSYKNINFFLRKISYQFFKLLFPILLYFIGRLCSCPCRHHLTVGPNSSLVIISIPVLLLLLLLFLLPLFLIWVLFPWKRSVALLDIILGHFCSSHQLIFISIMINEARVKFLNI